MEYSLKHRVRLPQEIKNSSSHITPKKYPSVIMLHGVGGNEDDFFTIGDQIDDNFIVISTRGPVEQSKKSFAWFRTSPFPEDRNFFLDDAENSRFLLVNFINEVVANYDVDPEQIYLFGYDQGATICLSALFTDPGLICGIVAISGEVLPEVLHMRVSKHRLTKFPVFLAYGVHDQSLAIVEGRRTKDLLASFSDEIYYREYPIGHQLSSINIKDACNWLSYKFQTNKHSFFSETKARIHLGHVELRVRDLDRSITFYKRFLGLKLTERIGKVYAFLSGSYHHHDLALQSVGLDAIDLPPDSIGTVNVAFEATNQIDFAKIYKNLIDAKVQVRTADHHISWSIYFLDPDGHEIEVYYDTRDQTGRSDLWQGRDLPLSGDRILNIIDNDVNLQ